MKAVTLMMIGIILLVRVNVIRSRLAMTVLIGMRARLIIMSDERRWRQRLPAIILMVVIWILMMAMTPNMAMMVAATEIATTTGKYQQ